MYGNVLTGGIACGKSTVANMLRLYGYHVIDADSVAHEMLDKNASVIAKNFGENVLLDSKDSKKVNRAILAQIIFNDNDKKKLLESILHPLIFEQITKQSEILENKKKPYFMDIPLYFETKNVYKARFIICVYADKEMQLQRLIMRNNLSKDEALKRIESQIDIEIKRKKSDFVINNTSDLKTLQKNIESFLQQLEKIYEAH